MKSSEELLRFILVGCVNTLFGYTCFAFFIFIHSHYSLALRLSTLLGIMFNFKTLGRFVFHNNSPALLGKFLLVYGVVYGFNSLIIRFMQDITPSLYVAGMVALGPAAMLAFCLNKFFVFRKSHETD